MSPISGRLAGRALIAAACCLFVAGDASGDVIRLSAAADNTIYSEAEGVSNGAGQYLFAGRTNLGSRRRGLIRFDLENPLLSGPGVTINSVTLQLHVSRTAGATQPVRLNRLTRSWGEGTSDAGQNEGGGADATFRDATWFSRFWTIESPWATPGGDAFPTVSATTNVGDIGFYSWTGPVMVADAQAWLTNPSVNHGWLMTGVETTNRTAKRFDSRENSVPEFQPVLIIDYTRIPTPGGAALLVLGAAAALRRRR